MNMSVAFPSASNVHGQSSGPCVVCDETSGHQHHHQTQQTEFSTVHPSCLSRVTAGSEQNIPSSSASVTSSTSSSSSTTSTISTNLPDGAQLRLCNSCNELQSPLNFPTPMNDHDHDHVHAVHSYMSSNQGQTCYDCSMDMLDYDFGSSLASTSDYDDTTPRATESMSTWPAEFIICASCQTPKDLQGYSTYTSMFAVSDNGSYNMIADAGTASVICNDCMISISNSQDGQQQQYYFNGYAPSNISTADIGGLGNSYCYSLASSIDENDNTTYHGLPQLETLTLGLSGNNSRSDCHGTITTTTTTTTITNGNNTTTTNSGQHPPRTKRKQIRRPKTGVTSSNTETTATKAPESRSSSPNGTVSEEPVIQWISRREPLPPNVCSRCRCRYVRPGKKQCQHCAYDYRGTRDHRASMGLCITCAEPLDRDADYVHVPLATQEYQNTVACGGEKGMAVQTGGGITTAAGGGGGGGSGPGAKPRRSCKACREKNRLKKAADKAARLKMMATNGGGGGGSSDGGYGNGNGKMGVNTSIGSGSSFINGATGMVVGGGERYVYPTS